MKLRGLIFALLGFSIALLTTSLLSSLSSPLESSAIVCWRYPTCSLTFTKAHICKFALSLRRDFVIVNGINTDAALEVGLIAICVHQ